MIREPAQWGCDKHFLLYTALHTQLLAAVHQLEIQKQEEARKTIYPFPGYPEYAQQVIRIALLGFVLRTPNAWFGNLLD